MSSRSLDEYDGYVAQTHTSHEDAASAKLAGSPYRNAFVKGAADESKVQSLLRCEELCLSYDGLRNNVNRVSFSVTAGEIFALIGPNGAGKTSTLRMLATLLEPTSGRIELDGFDLRRAPHQARPLIGYLPDNFALYDQLTPVLQLLFFARLYGVGQTEAVARIDKLLAEFDLLDHRDRCIGEFSRGMKQRLGLAKTLLHRPKLLLLDEPASALDPSARAKLRESLIGLKSRGQTIIISSHILPDLAGLADSVGILERGRLVYTGPVDDHAVSLGSDVPYRIQTLAPERAVAVFDQFGPRLHSASGDGAGGFEVVIEGGPDVMAELIERLAQAGARVFSVAAKETAIEAVYRMSAAKNVA